MAPGDYMTYNRFSSPTSTEITDVYCDYYDNYIVEYDIVINDKPKYKIEKQIGNYSKPKMKKKQYSRLVCRRG